MQANEITPLYDSREDRLRLIFNIHSPNRYDMWLTRAFLIRLLDKIEALAVEERVVESGASQESAQSEEATIYPFEKETRLIESVDITTLKDGRIFLRFFDGNETVELLLTPQQLFAFIRYIKNQVRFGWGIF